MDVLLDQHRLTDQLGALLGRDLSKYDRVNESKDTDNPMGTGEDYQSWYDEEMMRWVFEADGVSAATLGYFTPFLPSDRLPIRRHGA